MIDPNKLDDICRGRHGGQQTSEEANSDVAPSKERLRNVILALVKDAGQDGLTCWEVEQTTGMSHQTASARCSELRRDGLVRRSGARRPTGTGSMAYVLIATGGKEND